MPKSKFAIFKGWSNLTIPPDFPTTSLWTFISAPVTQTNHTAHNLFFVLTKQGFQICSPGQTPPIPKQSPNPVSLGYQQTLLREANFLCEHHHQRHSALQGKQLIHVRVESEVSTWAWQKCRFFTAAVVLAINEAETAKKPSDLVKTSRHTAWPGL